MSQTFWLNVKKKKSSQGIFRHLILSAPHHSCSSENYHPHAIYEVLKAVTLFYVMSPVLSTWPSWDFWNQSLGARSAHVAASASCLKFASVKEQQRESQKRFPGSSLLGPAVSLELSSVHYTTPCNLQWTLYLNRSWTFVLSNRVLIPEHNSPRM